MSIPNLKTFWRWHPEVAIRYLPIVDKLQKLGRGSVLEVGSGGLGIGPYLGWPMTALDINFQGPKLDFINYVLGSGLKIPFPNKSFDYVICADVLEHISAPDRQKIINEITRVTRKLAVIAFPSGELAASQDKELAGNFEKKFCKKFSFFEEHKKFGLPNIDIKNAEVVGNENLALRKFLMTGWITNNLFINIFFRKIMLIILPFLFLFNQPPYYRKIYFVKP